MSNTKTCDQCGKAFEPTSPTRKFCCRKCYLEFWQAHRQAGKRICPVCGLAFLPSHAGAKYCSQDCFNEYQRSGRVGKTCPSCGKSFQNAPSRDYIYCSWECYKEGLKLRAPTGVSKTCPSCGRRSAGANCRAARLAAGRCTIRADHSQSRMSSRLMVFRPFCRPSIRRR